MAKRAKSALPELEKPKEKVVSIVKKITKTKTDDISSDQMVKKAKPYCPEDMVSVKTSAGILSRPFMVGQYNAPHLQHIQIRGYVDFYGGYAKHTREVLSNLEDTGKVCCKLLPIPSPRDIDPILANKMDWYMTNPAFKKKYSTFISIAGPGHMRQDKIPQDDRRKIGWTMIETQGVQPRIVNWLNNMDEIWAPTYIDVNRFEEAGVKNVHHMPLGYDDSMWHPDVEPMHIAGLENRYVFGVLGSWNTRKSVKEIVQAYITSFNKREPVTLLLNCKYGTRKWGTEEEKEDDSRWCIQYELEKYINELGYTKDTVPHISIVDIPLHPSVMPHLASRFDCLVGFSKGESSWLPGLEVGALKKPIIQLASNCSGFMDYLGDNPYMCKHVEYRTADQELYEGTSEYYKGEKLAHGDYEELGQMMRDVMAAQGTSRQRTICERLYHDNIKHRTWKRTVRLMFDRLHI